MWALEVLEGACGTRLSLKFAQTTAYALAIAEMVKFPAAGLESNRKRSS